MAYVVGFNLSSHLLKLYTTLSTSGADYGRMLGYGWRNYHSQEFQNNSANIQEYFRYKGSTETRTIQFSDSWHSRYTYPVYFTGTMSSPYDEKRTYDHANIKQLHQDMYEVQNSLDSKLKELRKNNNIDFDRMEWFKSFNRYRLIDASSVLGNSQGYVFFTRPDLNITQAGMGSDIGLLLFNMQTQHPEILNQLIDKSSTQRHRFAPLLCNRCTGIDIQDEELETRELADTITGWKLNYGGNLLKSETAGTVTTSFIDDEKLSIYLIFKIWCEYISAVSRGVLSPANDKIKRMILDYAISIHYFLTDATGEDIIFWTKYTGCIPTTIPSSNFSDSKDHVKLPQYSIQWKYAFKHDYDPYTLAEFNNLSQGGGWDFNPIYDAGIGRTRSTMMGSPFIDTKTSGKVFKIRFRKPGVGL